MFIGMERIVRVFASHSDADRVDAERCGSLTPQQRLDLALEIIWRHNQGLGEAAERFERAHRVDELAAS